jgi:cell division protein FtsQ
MARRLAFAPARSGTARRQLSPATLRTPSLRALAVPAALTAALSLGYVAARETSLFAVRAVEISGASRQTERDVRGELEPLSRSSLVALDADDLERRLEELPAVRSAEVDRAFPHTLDIVIREERPRAVLRDADNARLVSDTGRVIRILPPRALPRLPRIWIAGVASLAPGETLSDRSARLALGVLSAVPARFPARLVAARAKGGAVTLILIGGRELRLGPPRAVRPKLEAAAAVLTALSADERAGLGYLDVSVPNRPVAGIDPQVESEG